jgi:hypothetical protein
MKKYFILTITILTVLNSYGQETDSLKSKNDGVMIRLDGPSMKHGAPLYIITADNKKLQIPDKADNIDSLATTKTLNYINPNWIETVNVLKGNEATEKYGQLGKNGVILIGLKDGTLEKFPIEFRERFKD